MLGRRGERSIGLGKGGGGGGEMRYDGDCWGARDCWG